MSLDDTPNEFGIGLMTLVRDLGFEPRNVGTKIPCLNLLANPYHNNW